jgi:hypothetical protein
LRPAEMHHVEVAVRVERQRVVGEEAEAFGVGGHRLVLIVRRVGGSGTCPQPAEDGFASRPIDRPAERRRSR